LAKKIQREFPKLDLSVWYLDDGTIIGNMEDVHAVFELIAKEGPALGLNLNVKKNEIWWPNRAEKDPFPKEVDRISNEGVKLLGAPIGGKAFTEEFVKKKLVSLQKVCSLLREVDDAQVELGLFRGCLSYNKINHLLRTCPPELLTDCVEQFDGHFQDMLTEILRVPSLAEDKWEHASLPTRLSGLGITQTKSIAGSAYVGSCMLTLELVGDLLGRGADYVPAGLLELLEQHEANSGVSHDLESLKDKSHVQKVLSDEWHQAAYKKLREQSDVRTQNLMLACTMAHASDWLLTPPIPGLGLHLKSDAFRMALKFRLGLPIFESSFPCPAQGKDGSSTCGVAMDVYGDHAICCNHGTSRVFRHNNLRDILAHAAKAAGLSAVAVEKKNQIAGSKRKPGDITVQQYHRGFSTSAFDVTVAHPLQKKHIEVAMSDAGVVAQAAHDRKLQKSLEVCREEGIQFVPLAWESTGGATESVHEVVRKWTLLEAARGGYSPALIRQTLYSQISCCLQRHLGQAILDRRDELPCARAL
jgi:hypothetical protein